jgi:hypothetical protein
MAKQVHTMEGPPVEYIGEYAVDDNEPGMHYEQIVIVELENKPKKKKVLSVLGKIMRFLHS